MGLLGAGAADRRQEGHILLTITLPWECVGAVVPSDRLSGWEEEVRAC
jgi:hypothetical protein